MSNFLGILLTIAHYSLWITTHPHAVGISGVKHLICNYCSSLPLLMTPWRIILTYYLRIRDLQMRWDIERNHMWLSLKSCACTEPVMIISLLSIGRWICRLDLHILSGPLSKVLLFYSDHWLDRGCVPVWYFVVFLILLPMWIPWHRRLNSIQYCKTSLIPDDIWERISCCILMSPPPWYCYLIGPVFALFQVLIPKEELSLDVIKQYRVVVNSRDKKYQILKVWNSDNLWSVIFIHEARVETKIFILSIVLLW